MEQSTTNNKKPLTFMSYKKNIPSTMVTGAKTSSNSSAKSSVSLSFLPRPHVPKRALSDYGQAPYRRESAGGGARYSSSSVSSSGMAELATQFLEENVRNCIKPRIFPMETARASSSPERRTGTPILFASSTRDLYLQRRIQRSTDTVRMTLAAAVQSSDHYYCPPVQDMAVVQDRRPAVSIAGPASPQHRPLKPKPPPRTRLPLGPTLTLPQPATSNAMNSATASSPSRKPRTEVPAAQQQQPGFASTLKKYVAPLPPALVRKLGRTGESPLGKVKVMLKVCDTPDDQNSTLGIDQRKKQVTLIDPGGNPVNIGVNGSSSSNSNNSSSGSSLGITPEERRVGVSAPKMFAFDGIFGEDDDQAEICGAAGAELVASVVGGEDGCFVSLGYCSGGKKQTVFGRPSPQKLGFIPIAISWLYRSIHEQRQKTGARFSVRVSAVEITGGSGPENIKDLLVPFVLKGDQPPGAYLDSGQHKSYSSTPPILNTISEVRAPNPETAGTYLDAALEAMSKEDPARHFLFTLHVYQYSTTDKSGKAGVGGRSRLHCVLLGNGSPSLSVLGGLLLAVLNGQRHLPSKESKLGAILRECLGSLTCRAVVMLHVSGSYQKYAETLAALQLASRVHRLRTRSRRFKMGSVSSGTGSGGSSGGSGEEMRMNLIGLGSSSLGCVGESDNNLSGCGGPGTSSSDFDPSSSEQSCDTVIYLGPSMDDATDGEHPPVYLPSLVDSGGGGGSDDRANGKLHGQLSLTSSTGIPQPPKTKSPKPKGKIDMTYNSDKSQEKWVDGPTKIIKYGGGGSKNGSSGRKSADSGTTITSATNKKNETWIDGPAATRVKHQASNFPSPKKSIKGQQQQRHSGIPMAGTATNADMSLTKAEMIQKWISNQTFVDDFGGNESHKRIVDMESPFSALNGNTNKGMSNLPSGSLYAGLGKHYGGYGSIPTSPAHMRHYNNSSNSNSPSHARNQRNSGGIYGDQYTSRGNGVPGCGLVGNGVEMIQVVNPEPVVSRDAWLQVTEQDIAQSTAQDTEDNLLPESDQNRGTTGYLSCKTGYEMAQPHQQRPNTEVRATNGDHPLRVLSEECLTVVSTFTDSLSAKGEQMERFWPRLSFQDSTTFETQTSELDDLHDMCSGLCKNLGSLSQLSLNRAHTAYAERQRIDITNFGLDTLDHLSPQSSPFHTLGHSTKYTTPPSNMLIGSCYSLPKKLKPVGLPELSDGGSTVFNVSDCNFDKAKDEFKSKDLSDTDPDDMPIPPMKLLDLTPIRSHNGSVASIPVSDSFVDTTDDYGEASRLSTLLSPEPDIVPSSAEINPYNSIVYESPRHRLYSSLKRDVNGPDSSNLTLTPEPKHPNVQQMTPVPTAINSPSKAILIDTPPASPSPLQEITKSPSKSKSRKIAKFFRSRSKSPKTTVVVDKNSSATSGSDSGKSSASHSSLLSGGSSISPKGKLSSSSSNSSGASSACPSSAKIGSVIAISASKLASPKKSAIPAPLQKSIGNNAYTKLPLPRSIQGQKGTPSEYHYVYDSNLPIFLPTPNTAA